MQSCGFITSVEQIKQQMVYNCFIKCGFPDKGNSNVSAELQDNEAKKNFRSLLDVFGLKCNNILYIDNYHETEDTPLNKEEIVSS